MIKFKDDEFLGKTVKNTRLYCSIGVDPIKDLFQLRYAGGGNKFSSLCGFMFDTAAEGAEFPRFMVSFVCKLRSKIYRQQQHNPSQWFIFRRINKSRVDVLDKKALLVNYGFDIDKFFDSDLFKTSIPKFEKCLKKGLQDAEAFAKHQKDDAIQTECRRYIKSISDSLPVMTQSKRVNDKYFQLNDLDAIAKNASVGISADAKKKALDAKMAAIRKGNKRFMDKVAANQRDVDLRQAEESEENVDDTAKIESDNDNKDSAEKTNDCDVKEKELDNVIEETIDKSIPKNWIAFCKDLRSKIETDVKVLVGKHFNDFKGSGTELVNSILNQIDYLMFDEDDYNESGNLYDSYFHTDLNSKTEAEEKQEAEEDNEEKIKEKELDNDIEESLKEIYK